MSPEPFVSRAKAPPAKKSEKAMGTRMVAVTDKEILYLLLSFLQGNECFSYLYLSMDVSDTCDFWSIAAVW